MSTERGPSRGWVGHAGWGGSCRVGWVMQGRGGSSGVGWVMKGWDGSSRGGVGMQGWVGHAGLGWCGDGWVCRFGVGWVMQGGSGGSSRGGVRWVIQRWDGVVMKNIKLLKILIIGATGYLIQANQKICRVLNFLNHDKWQIKLLSEFLCNSHSTFYK